MLKAVQSEYSGIILNLKFLLSREIVDVEMMTYKCNVSLCSAIANHCLLELDVTIVISRFCTLIPV